MISDVFALYAYSPWLVYGAVCLFMLLSAFGMPIPEEVVLLSAGFVGNMALHPDQYPPPSPGAESVNPYVLATVVFFAVLGADFLIYSLGRKFGPRLFRMRFFSRMVNDQALNTIQKWTKKYGYWAVFIFRFTPGVRFPGHLMCGAMGLSPVKFLAVDTVAAGFSVPTQVLLISFYGEVILGYLKPFKVYLFSAMAIGLIGFLTYKFVLQRCYALRSAPPAHCANPVERQDETPTLTEI